MSGTEHIVFDHNDKKNYFTYNPIETLLNYEFYHIEEETKEECAHLLADSYTKNNRVDILAGITYEHDYIYYTAIVKRSMIDKLEFYLYSRKLKKILLFI